MENKIQVFESNKFGNVRVIEREGKPWFVAADVCKALEISNSRDALSRIDEDEKGVASTDTLGGKQDMAIVNESGLFEPNLYKAAWNVFGEAYRYRQEYENFKRRNRSSEV